MLHQQPQCFQQPYQYGALPLPASSGDSQEEYLPHFFEPLSVADQRDGKGIPLTKPMFRGLGVLLLVVLCSLPIWDAFALMGDFNFRYWVGGNLPLLIISGIAIIFVVFLLTAEAMFTQLRPEFQTTQTLTMAVSLFVLMLGFVMIAVSIPIWSWTHVAHAELLHGCESSEEALFLRTHYQALLDLRQSSGCVNKTSVEDCAGFHPLSIHTAYLALLESEFRCSGFCHNGPASLQAQNNVTLSPDSFPSPLANQEHDGSPAAEDTQGSPNERAAERLRIGGGAVGGGAESLLSGRRMSPKLPSSARAVSVSALAGAGVSFPPTLFSKANFKVSCEGAAARQLSNFAMDISLQGWRLGITLIAVSILMGFSEWTVGGSSARA